MPSSKGMELRIQIVKPQLLTEREIKMASLSTVLDFQKRVLGVRTSTEFLMDQSSISFESIAIYKSVMRKLDNKTTPLSLVKPRVEINRM